jgi:hypothetical protein
LSQWLLVEEEIREKSFDVLVAGPSAPRPARLATAAHPHLGAVTVNERPVTFQYRWVTDLEIKQTAIAHDVPIQLDFALFRINPRVN